MSLGMYCEMSYCSQTSAVNKNLFVIFFSRAGAREKKKAGQSLITTKLPFFHFNAFSPNLVAISKY